MSPDSSSDAFSETLGWRRGRPAELPIAGKPTGGLLDVLAAELFAGMDCALLPERAKELGATVRQQQVLISNPKGAQSWELEHPDLDRAALLVAERDMTYDDPVGFDVNEEELLKPTIQQVQCFVLDRRWERPPS